ncbi:glycosyltransferase family 32 protein [Methylobacterium sp. SI9]|uniref:glycosyltransferase family 32 protein n=1 Tax=Methylobacterium guangdongense TaxID=3138811 RepID=UPI00313B6C51
MRANLLSKLGRFLNRNRLGAFQHADCRSRIPKLIHQLWIKPTHLDDIPDDVVMQVRAWKELYPDFRHRLWTIDEVAKSLPDARAKRMMGAIGLCRFEAMKADIVRLYILQEFGGFWSDLKVKPIRRWLDDYLDKDVVLIEHFKFALLQDPAGVLTNNLIGSMPNNRFINFCIDRAHQNINSRLSTSVCHIAGVKIYMDILAEMKGRNEWTSNSIILNSDDVWGRLVELGHGSYSADQRHWSVREKTESIYL